MLPSNGLGSGPGEVGQGGQKVLFLWCHSNKKFASSKQKILFECKLEDCQVFWSFEQLSTTSDTWVTHTQSHVRSGCFLSKVARRQSVK